MNETNDEPALPWPAELSDTKHQVSNNRGSATGRNRLEGFGKKERVDRSRSWRTGAGLRDREDYRLVRQEVGVPNAGRAFVVRIKATREGMIVPEPSAEADAEIGQHEPSNAQAFDHALQPSLGIGAGRVNDKARR